MYNILIVMPLDEQQRNYLEMIGKDCIFTYRSVEGATEEDVAGADIIFGNVPPARLAAAKDLKWMQLNSAGADAYCKPGVLPEQTLLTCAKGAYGVTVSEWMVTAHMMLARKMDLYAKNQAEHGWNAAGAVTSAWGSVVVCLGLGDIGGMYARSMKGMGSYIIGVTKHPHEKPEFADEMFTIDRLEEVLPRADVLAMIMPGTPETKAILNADTLKLLKPTAYVINAGRGNAIDMDALNDALRSGTIAGAALDVTDPEPLPPEHPLWDAPRCIITPHIAGNFFLAKTLNDIVSITGRNLTAYLTGSCEGMESVVDRREQY